MNPKVEAYLIELLERYPLLEPLKEELVLSYGLLKTCFESGHKLLIGGNGGSSADAEHIVGELMKGFEKLREIPVNFSKELIKTESKRGRFLSRNLQGGLPAICLSSHTSFNTAFSNDVEVLAGYAQQVYVYGTKGDVFLGISTSGNAENVVCAAVTARTKGMPVIALTGNDGGDLKEYADVALIVPETGAYRTQELHLPIYHALCLMLEETFFSEADA